MSGHRCRPEATGAVARRSLPARRGRLGWVLFDWATQPFYTLVVTFLFAPYFANGFMGDPVKGQALWGGATGAAELLVAALSPMLGAVADAGGRRKPWIAAFSLAMAAGMAGLWFAAPGQPQWAVFVLAAYGLALIGTELATVFNNAMMTELAPASRLGRLSGLGWAVGYVGGLVSLVIMAGCLIADPGAGKTALGIAPVIALDAEAREGERLVGPFSALWYLVFVIPFFLFTPDRARPSGETAVPWREGLRRLWDTLRHVRKHGNVARFLLARMLYADGLTAILTFGGIYAASAFGWGAYELGLFGIILTLAGAIGCWLGGRADDRFGSKAVIGVTLLCLIFASAGVLSVDRTHVLYIVIVAERAPGAAPFASTGEQVYLGFTLLIGLAVGPVQSSARTLLARLAPPDRMTEFFGLFAFSGKATAFAAPLTVSAVTLATGSQRLGIATAIVFLIAGLLLLTRVREPA